MSGSLYKEIEQLRKLLAPQYYNMGAAYDSEQKLVAVIAGVVFALNDELKEGRINISTLKASAASLLIAVDMTNAMRQ